MNQDMKYEIIENRGVLYTSKSGWRMELNIISWNDGQPKLDLRMWSEDHSRMSKGVTLTKADAEKLVPMLVKYIGEVD